MSPEDERKGEVISRVFAKLKLVEASDNPNANTTLDQEEVQVLCETIRILRDR